MSLWLDSSLLPAPEVKTGSFNGSWSVGGSSWGSDRQTGGSEEDNVHSTVARILH